MKKADTEIVYCCECSPFRRFFPPNAADQVREHYDIGEHNRTTYAGGLAVRVDA